ncbi:hypothetical protein HMPREF1042_1465 [Streptococcus constellatus subsp. pharyngis SK1060 = CCUG 46377]|uniref:Uncharacterized protein n=1 Tax=Streptococcus constellatus subsp. pharyngis SK1060 = CCUG 46377 TaxID=1035184 RepID=F9P8B0_STRCV|nr:hypothetical protein HMPREF1042_1465 [Streptococcus constellatus subsp. pharyngis SK1060 = CCUG 46377]
MIIQREKVEFGRLFIEVKENKQVPVGMLFLVLAIILNRVSSISDLVIGILYGISIGVLTIGIINDKK